MTTTVIDAVSIAAGATETAEHNLPSRGQGWQNLYYVSGDGSATDVTLEFAIQPQDGNTYHTVDGATVGNIDASGGIAIRPGVRGGSMARVSVTNNGASAATVTVKTDETH